MPVLDIFDEVDALMTAKKSFVYAVGSASPLPSQILRFEYSKVMIEIIVKEMFDFLLKREIAVIEESEDQSREKIKAGTFPQGIRFSVMVDGPSRGYVLEVYDNHFVLPNLGPIGKLSFSTL